MTKNEDIAFSKLHLVPEFIEGGGGLEGA